MWHDKTEMLTEAEEINGFHTRQINSLATEHQLRGTMLLFVVATHTWWNTDRAINPFVLNQFGLHRRFQ